MTPYAKLAKSTAEQYVKTRRVPPIPAYLAPELTRQQACYIYLFENPGQRLRGLYGEPLPRYPSLAQEIMANTIAAISSRINTPFVRRVELSALTYTVAVLGALQRISDPASLNPKLFGLFVTSDQRKSAVVLPERAGIETAQDQVATALRESGINPKREAAVLYRFPVTYHD